MKHREVDIDFDTTFIQVCYWVHVFSSAVHSMEEISSTKGMTEIEILIFNYGSRDCTEI